MGCGPDLTVEAPDPVASPGTAVPSEPLQPDLVVVLVSGLRADPPGEPGAEAAFLEPFADEITVLATAAYAQSPDPVVSLGSVLTGRYPSAIPICGSVRRGEGSGLEEAWCHRLPEGVESLPGVLAHYGYRSALVHSLGPVPGLAEAFDLELAVEPGATAWDTVRGPVDTWWDGMDVSPRLLVLQLGDLDLPRRPELLAALGPEAQDWAGLGPLAPALAPGRPRAQERLPPRRPPCTPLAGQQVGEPVVWDALAGGEVDHERQRSELLTITRVEAARLGRALHRELALLDSGRPRVVVLAGLHGMSIGELGGTLADEAELLWSDRVVDRTVHVPLAIVAPAGAPPRVVDQPVELVDLLPTLLARAGAVFPHGVPGQDLLGPAWREDLDGEVAYVEYGDMLALRRGDLLLTMRAMVHNISSLDPYLTEVLACPGLVGGLSLHDVRADPLQAVDLLETHQAEAEALEALMLERRNGPGAPAEAVLQDDHLLQLRLTQADGYW
jgi:hypothetical protein